MKAFFDFRKSSYNLRKCKKMRHEKVRSIRCGLAIALYPAPQPWSIVPADLKSLPNDNMFKSKINHSECTECPCKLCKTYQRNIEIKVMFNIS